MNNQRRNTRHSPAWAACFGFAIAIALSACGKQEKPAPELQVEAPTPGPIAQIEPPTERETAPTPAKPELPPLFRDIERRTFQFFWDTTNEVNGMTPDRFPSRLFSSIASTGFALTAYPIGIENGWVSRTQAVDRALLTLKFLRQARQESKFKNPNSKIHNPKSKIANRKSQSLHSFRIASIGFSCDARHAG